MIYWLCLVPQKCKGKCEGKKIERKNGRKGKTRENNNEFKINKLFLHATLNSFYLFTFQYKD